MKPFNGPRSLEVQSPYDGALVGSAPRAGPDGVARALDAAHRLFRNRDGWLTRRRRIEILSATADLMEREADDLALQAAREGGKPLADSRVEVARAIDGVRNCCEALRSDAGTVVPMNVSAASAGRIAFTQREPTGGVVAAGATPLSCFRLGAMLHEAGLPEPWRPALALEGDAPAGELVTDPRVGFLSFIGGARVGWSLRSRLAPGARSALGHGGAAPVIVAPGADLEPTAAALAKGGSCRAGQVCVSVQRAFAHASIAAELGTRPGERASASKVGDPVSPDTEIGPPIRPSEVERVRRRVEKAVAGAGAPFTGGRPSREEAFWPVLALYGFDDLGDACARANGRPWAFQAAVFSLRPRNGHASVSWPRRPGRDAQRSQRLPRRLDAVRGLAPIRSWSGRRSIHLPRNAGGEALRGPSSMISRLQHRCPLSLRRRPPPPRDETGRAPRISATTRPAPPSLQGAGEPSILKICKETTRARA